jgi:hypothetical protein
MYMYELLFEPAPRDSAFGAVARLCMADDLHMRPHRLDFTTRAHLPSLGERRHVTCFDLS